MTLGELIETPGRAAFIEYWTPTDAILEDAEMLADCWDNQMSDHQRDKWERSAQAAIDTFLAGDSVSAETIREALAAHEQPAPGLAALREQLAKARAATGEMAQENIRLAAEKRALRDAIAELAADVQKSADATRPSKKTSIEDEIAIALRKLLEET